MLPSHRGQASAGHGVCRRWLGACDPWVILGVQGHGGKGPGLAAGEAAATERRRYPPLYCRQ